MKKFILAGIAALSVLALSACGTSGSSTDAASGSSAKTTTKITVGAVTILSTAPLYLGVKKGFFSDEGLDVNIQASGGGAATIPGVVSGSIDFAFGNLVSLMVARDKGLDLRVVTNAVSNTGNTKKDIDAIIVKADSPIKTVADLAGKTISVNNLQNLGDITTRYVVDAAGADSSHIKFVEVAFPNIQAALDNNQIDAAYQAEPFLTPAVESGYRAFYIHSMMNPKQDLSGYFTTGDTIKNKPELVKAFKTAMNKSLVYAQNHSDEALQIAATYTKITPEVLARVTLPIWQVEMNKAAAEQYGKAAYKYGVLSKEPNVDELLP